MTGKSHKIIGISIAAALFIARAKSGDYTFAPLLVTSPIGAMIPDIDCNTSKIGRQRKKIVHFALVFTFISVVCYTIYFHMKTGSISVIYNTILWIFIPLLVFILLTHMKMFNNVFKFASKHRGVTHTLLLPLVFGVGYILSEDIILKNAILGLGIGSLSHIIVDCMNPKGCPILFPFTFKNISILKVNTGSFGEYLLTGILCILVIALPLFIHIWG